MKNLLLWLNALLSFSGLLIIAFDRWGEDKTTKCFDSHLFRIGACLLAAGVVFGAIYSWLFMP